MATTKTFETLFRIQGKYLAGPAFAKTQKDLTKTATLAQKTNVRLKGMFKSMTGALVAYNIGAKAIASFTQTLRKSVLAAADAQESHDELALSMERNVKRYADLRGKSEKEIARLVKADVNSIIARTEAMEKLGHDAETVQKGLSKLMATGAMAPKAAEETAKAFSDVLSYVAGANATAEESAELGEQWADTILRGNITLAKRLDLTDSEILELKEINKLHKEGEIDQALAIKARTVLTAKWAAKFKDETKRVFDKPSGKVEKMWIAIENIYETLGEPFIARAGSMAESFTEIAKSVEPIATKLAEITDTYLKKFSDWLKEHKTELPVWLENIWTALDNIRKVLQAIEDFEFGAVMKLLKMLGILPGAEKPPPKGVIPGTPTAINPALQQGRAGQIYRENLQKARTGTQGGTGQYYSLESTPPYSIEVRRAEAVQKAEEQAATQVIKQKGPGGNIQDAAEDAAAIAQITAAEKARILAEAENRKIPAAIRNRNPGAMYPGKAAQRFGTIGTQSLLGGKHLIAQFPTAVHGAAANMWNLANKGYVGKTVGEVIKKWSGNYRSVPGPAGTYDKDMVITPEMMNDKDFMIAFMQAIASAEAPGGHKVLSQRQWDQAYKWYQKGSPGDSGFGRAGQSGKAATEATPIAATATASPTPFTERVRKAIPVTSMGTRVIKGPESANTNPFGLKLNRYYPEPPPKAKEPRWQKTPKTPKTSALSTETQMQNAMMRTPGGEGSKLKSMIKDINTRQRVEGASGGTNVASNPTINIHGIATENARAVGESVRAAVGESSNELLAKLKQARDSERRLSYV